jgi:prephenate dehydrogenase
MSILFNKVTIIGVGLIGGSLAKVLKGNGLAKEITGAGRGRRRRTCAQDWVIDRGVDLSSVEDADLVSSLSGRGIRAYRRRNRAQDEKGCNPD